MNTALNFLPDLKGVHQEIFESDQSFEQIAANFADDEGTVILLSGGGLECSRYDILAVRPWLTIKSRQDTVCLKYEDQKFELSCDPFDVVADLLVRFSLKNIDSAIPVCAGLFGYFAYDLKDRIETLPVTCMDTGLPDLCLYAPSIILFRDKRNNQMRLYFPKFDVSSDIDKIKNTDKTKFSGFHEFVRNFFYDKIRQPVKRTSFSLDYKGFHSSFTKAEYIDCVKKIIEYLKAGDIYQANLSQRFEAGFSGDTYALFLDLFERNPAAFFSYIHAGDHKIVSTSPERFLKRVGNYVETRPIKGTIARGVTQVQDEENSRMLAQSLKDDAELTMIVDLMRNDLSRVTEYGSVVVSEHKCIEPYENVFHLVSVVQAILEPDKTSVDLLKAAFPGGSITGCPKIRSMEIIDELEPVKRHVYTGSIGYISFHDTLDLSIAIRTATITDNRIMFSVGGGIVYDSDPEKEYQETLVKGKTLMESLSGRQSLTASVPERKAWANGRLMGQRRVKISAGSTGFQYGAGVFETIRVEGDRIFRLKEHIERMNASWQSIFDETPPNITWKAVIRLLIRENKFKDPVLAVKLMMAKDEQNFGRPHFMAAFLRPYIHRLELTGKDGLDLITYPHARQSPLADHKTLNYLYYEQAMRYAGYHGKDEALILNIDNTVSETNTANILAIEGNTVWVPKSLHMLPGVTQNSVLTILSDRGYDICQKQILEDEFYFYPNIILTNALMGAVKVLSINGKKIDHTSDIGSQDICSQLNAQLFNLQG